MNKQHRTRQYVVDCIEQSLISNESISEALKRTGVTPSPQKWSDFLQKSLLWLGSLALSFSLLFFIAANWKALGHFGKFALAEGFILVSVALYCYKAKNTLIAQASLVSANIGLGVLLALYGQTYQTGADTWQLFATWALLSLPWTLVSRMPAMWIVLIALINTSLIIYTTTFQSLLPFFVATRLGPLWEVMIVNTVFLLIWELCSTKYEWLRQRWASRTIAVAAGSAITWLAVIEFAVQNRHNSDTLFIFLLWAVWIAILIYVYRKLRPDLFMLAGSSLSIMTVCISFGGRYLLDSLQASGFFLLTLLTIGLGALSTKWLKSEGRKMKGRAKE